MKKLVAVSIMLFVMNLVGCIVTEAQNKNAPKTVQQIPKRIGNIVYYIDADNPLEQCSFLIPRENVPVTSDEWGNSFPLPKKTILMLSPGIHSFHINYVGAGRVNGFEGLDVKAIFEPGKFYTFDYKIEGKRSYMISVFIIEVTDPNTIENAKKEIAAVKQSLTWSKDHPNALEGTYHTKNKKQEIIFAGNTFQITCPVSIWGRWVYKGTFCFNDKMITLRIDSMKALSKEMKPFPRAAFLSYQFFKNILNITNLEADDDAVSYANVRGQFFNDSFIENQ